MDGRKTGKLSKREVEGLKVWARSERVRLGDLFATKEEFERMTTWNVSEMADIIGNDFQFIINGKSINQTSL